MTISATRRPVAGRPPRSGPVSVNVLGPPLLGETSDWELLALTGAWEPGAPGGALIRIHFATGRITSTAVPPLDSDGPVSILPVGDEVIIRPLDFVPGYAVPDGGAARPLPAGLDHGGLVFPGPGPGQVWNGTYGDTGFVLRLVSATGAAARQEIRLPGGDGLSVPDGQGYLLVQAGNAVDDARPGRLRKVATGTLVAAGSSAWLVSSCPGAARCVNTVIDPATGARRVLPGDANLFRGPLPDWPPGQVAPDGRLAALLLYGHGPNATVRLVDLRTGAVRDTPIGRLSPNATLVWSPDCRWLFTITARGAIEAVDVRSGQIRGLGVRLRPVSYLSAGAPG